MGKHSVPFVSCYLQSSDAQLGTPYPRSVGFDTDTLKLGDEGADVVDGGGLRPKGVLGMRRGLGGCHGRGGRWGRQH